VRTSLRTSRMSRRKRGSSADRRVHVAAATAVRACRRLSPGWSSGGDGWPDGHGSLVGEGTCSVAWFLAGAALELILD
jgi:hypothetical protein